MLKIIDPKKPATPSEPRFTSLALVLNNEQRHLYEALLKGYIETFQPSGPVETDLWLGNEGVAETVGRATGAGASAVREQTEGGIATGRFSTPREIATLVVLLASPRTANVTGANWVIDGGMLKTT